MIKTLYNRYFGPTFQEMLDEAIKEASKLRGELEEARTRANYYTDAVNRIDPWKDHHSFAAARDKQIDAQIESVALEQKVEHATRQAEKLIAELTLPEEGAITLTFTNTYDDTTHTVTR